MSAAPGTPVLGAAHPRYGERIIRGMLFGAAMLSVVTTVGIVLSLVSETVRFLGEVSPLDFLVGTEWTPLFADPSFGVLPLVAGTAMTTVIALIVAIPLGLGSAVFLSEYASRRVRRVVKPVLEILAGVPTIVFGYFALTWFTPVVLNDLLRLDVPVFNVLGAGIIMGFMVLPTIASVSEDAMSAVPMSLREGAFGLGASRLQVSTRVVFPAALSGIVAAIVLGVSRAVGETMIVLVAAGGQPNLTADPTNPMATMTAFIAGAAKGDLSTGSIGYSTIFAVGMLLFLITLVMNLISIRLVSKYRQVYE